MAARTWTKIYLFCFLVIFITQVVILVHYARRLEDREDVAQLRSSISIESLLSKENVSASVKVLRAVVHYNNISPRIYNTDIFGNISSDAPIFVVQVHDRIVYLKALIESLSMVRGINGSLIVFSHDVYLKKMNQLVHSINFTRFSQIYYPYSESLYPRGFPGPDLANFVSQSKSKGFIRRPDLSQIKLHWAWKLYQVFRDLKSLRNHTGPRIFLEEDHFVAPDILHSLDKVWSIKHTTCPSCLIILGGYAKKQEFETGESLSWDMVRRVLFFSSGNNMGMVLDNDFWMKFLKCAYQFCRIDDYNWDWTLQHLNDGCFPNRLQILKLDAPRVFHVGDCGTHTKIKSQCGSSRQLSSVKKVRDMLKMRRIQLFPNSFRVVTQLKTRVQKTPNPFGGWADPRDHELCLAIVKDF